MDDFMKVIAGRRSIRRYRKDKIPEESLDKLLEAMRWSPSWANTQCWEVVVVRQQETRAKLQAILGRNPAHDAVLQVPAVLVLCAKKGKAGFKKDGPTTKLGDWFMYDIGIANQNLCLAAHALGLGTVIVGSFDQDAVGEVLGVPPEYQVVSMLPVGYPDHEPKAPPRREVSEFRHDEKF